MNPHPLCNSALGALEKLSEHHITPSSRQTVQTFICQQGRPVIFQNHLQNQSIFTNVVKVICGKQR